MSDLYLTIKSPARASLTVKRSRFLAFAYPVESAGEAKARVDELSREYFDARHVCWAYMLGAARTEFRANDNGEPSGTAGKPILGQINSRGLTDVLVVVVRYFGGIKLGTPGLIATYREAASLVLDEAPVQERHVTDRLTFTYPYSVMNDVMKITRLPGVKTLQTAFDNTCLMTLEINRDYTESYRARLDAIDGLTFTPDNQSK